MFFFVEERFSARKLFWSPILGSFPLPYTVWTLDTNLLIAVHARIKIALKFSVEKINAIILGPSPCIAKLVVIPPG